MFPQTAVQPAETVTVAQALQHKLTAMVEVLSKQAQEV